jgi:hypothetical protein
MERTELVPIRVVTAGEYRHHQIVRFQSPAVAPKLPQNRFKYSATPAPRQGRRHRDKDWQTYLTRDRDYRFSVLGFGLWRSVRLPGVPEETQLASHHGVDTILSDPEIHCERGSFSVSKQATLSGH